MNNPFFSIIIPVYNTEKYLNDCIDSILKQTFNDFQLILVDDGSTDNSSRICEEYKQLYNNKIEVIHKKNEGQLASRLNGLELAKGEYVYFVDSDDTVEPNLLSDVYIIIKKYNIDVVTFKWKYIDEKGNLIKSEKAIFYEGFIDKRSLLEKVISSYSLNSLCIKVIKKELFASNIDFNKYFFIKNAEDLLQSLPVFYNANSFYYVDKEYYNYRINNNSVTKKFDKREFYPLIYIRPLVYDYLIKLQFDSKENIKLFYSFVFLTLWENLCRYFTLCKNKNYDEDLSLLYSHTIKYRNWLRHIDLPLYKKITVLLFFWKCWNLLNIKFYLIYVFYVFGRAIKDKLIKLKF